MNHFRFALWAIMNYEPIIGQSLRQAVRNSSGKPQRKVESIRNGEGSSQDGTLPPWEEEFCSVVGTNFWMNLKVGIRLLVFILTSLAICFLSSLILRELISIQLFIFSFEFCLQSSKKISIRLLRTDNLEGVPRRSRCRMKLKVVWRL